MIRAFLSHTSVDKDLVGLVQEKLGAEISWYDAVDIENGDSIPEKINEGLRAATHYVLFWSEPASRSSWVKAELNAAFVRFLASKCRFMIFTLDDTELPELLQPYKYDKVSKANLEETARAIANTILAQEGSEQRLSEFVNRTKEIGEIEEAARAGYKLIILHGILGIGKASLAEKALQWLYPNRASNRVVLDFSVIPGLAELSIELSRKTKTSLQNDNSDEDKQKYNIRYFLEVISSSRAFLILKDVKNWLDDNGTPSKQLQYITDIIVSTNMFEGITIMTSSRFVEIPYDYYKVTQQIPIRGMADEHIAQIIRNNLPERYSSNDTKNIEFAKRLYGYPLGAKLGAYNISNHGYDYFLKQPHTIQKLQIGLAKQLVSFAGISEECQRYLCVLALSRSRLRNEEYGRAFPDMSESIPKAADEGFFAGILKFDDDGCYKLEPIVEDYYFDLAFNDVNRREICKKLGDFLVDEIKNAPNSKYLRLIPATIHLLTLSGNANDAIKLRAELTATMEKSMWDQYNHTEYEEAFSTAKALLDHSLENKEALYVKALCLTRFDEYDEAKEILEELLKSDTANAARYYYALGRIQKREGNYNEAIELFKVAVYEKPRYLSPYREMAECYIHMNDLDNAQSSIDEAKSIDDGNVFVMLLEAQLLQKQGRAERAIEILTEQSRVEKNVAQLKFRLGRCYDQLGREEDAISCYNESLSINSKMYDAMLCLLHHQIISAPKLAEESIESLKGKLRGKRRAILTNIEARLVGYVKHHESAALELLDKVKPEFRDKQWYAVKIQLIENLVERNRKGGRDIFAQRAQEDAEAVRKEFELKYGETLIRETDLLPDA